LKVALNTVNHKLIQYHSVHHFKVNMHPMLILRNPLKHLINFEQSCLFSSI